MACTCSSPIPVAQYERNRRRGEWGASPYCDACGEAFVGAPVVPPRDPRLTGVDPRLAARKRARAKARREQREVARPAFVPSPDSMVEGLQRGDRIVVRRVLEPFDIYVHFRYRRDPMTREWAGCTFEVKPGMIFRVSGVHRMTRRGPGRRTWVDLDGVGEGVKGYSISLDSGQLEFERLPRSYEMPAR